MTRRLLHHASRHSIAYLALVCSMLALAGASYAATKIGTNQLRNGAVTEPKIKNKTIDPVKWDPTYVTAFVRRLANISATGQYLSGSPSGASKTEGTTPGTYELTWGDAFASFCSPIVTVQSTGGAAGFANANIVTQQNNATVVFVHTYNTHGTGDGRAVLDRDRVPERRGRGPDLPLHAAVEGGFVGRRRCAGAPASLVLDSRQSWLAIGSVKAAGREGG